MKVVLNSDALVVYSGTEISDLTTTAFTVKRD